MLEKKENRLEVVTVRLVDAPPLYSEQEIRSPEDAVSVLADEIKSWDREVFAILNLKTTHQPINLNICSIGTLNQSILHPRDIFKASILSNSACFIAVHNHPSGKLQPSLDDLITTRRLVSCGEMLGIAMVDHVIVAGTTGEKFSFLKEGLMDVDRLDAKINAVGEPEWELY